MAFCVLCCADITNVALFHTVPMKCCPVQCSVNTVMWCNQGGLRPRWWKEVWDVTVSICHHQLLNLLVHLPSLNLLRISIHPISDICICCWRITTVLNKRYMAHPILAVIHLLVSLYRVDMVLATGGNWWKLPTIMTFIPPNGMVTSVMPLSVWICPVTCDVMEASLTTGYCFKSIYLVMCKAQLWGLRLTEISGQALVLGLAWAKALLGQNKTRWWDM